jgi:D-inositol-3-phosphate glycosyltransferase
VPFTEAPIPLLGPSADGEPGSTGLQRHNRGYIAPAAELWAIGGNRTGSLMKVAIVGDHYTAARMGGLDIDLGRYVAALAGAIAHNDHDVTVYTRRTHPQQAASEETPAGYRVVHVDAGPPQGLSARDAMDSVGELVRHLEAAWRDRDQRPDVVHAHSWTYGLAAQLAADTHSIPVVQAFHSLHTDDDRPAHRSVSSDRARIESLLAKKAAWVAASCSEDMFALARMRRTRARISALPAGIDLEVFDNVGSATARDRKYRVLCATPVLQSRNDIAAAIHALTRSPQTELLVAGGAEPKKLHRDPEARRLSALAESLGVGARVRLLGAVRDDEMPALLRSADLFVHTPWYAPCGASALQAMACGVPVLGSTVGALVDVIIHDVTGMLVAPRDSGELARAMRILLADPIRRQSMGGAGRTRARSRYSWSRIGTDTLMTYEKALSPHGTTDSRHRVRRTGNGTGASQLGRASSA